MTASATARLELAARNNAAWCDAVCRAYGAPGEFDDELWLTRRPAPPLYPNAVTLTARDGSASAHRRPHFA